MRFVDSGFEILEQGNTMLDLYKHVEKIARVSYKSEDKITEDSAKKMVDSLVKNKHLACLEHGTIYLYDTYDVSAVGSWSKSLAEKYTENKFSVVKYDNNMDLRGIYITTNARVIIENGWEADLNYICTPTEFHELRYSVKFIWPIGIVRDALRHRRFSFMNESTRWINYSKEKFGGLTIVIPRWIYDLRDEHSQYVDWPLDTTKDYLLDYEGEELVHQMSCEDRAVAAWVEALRRDEEDYFYLVSGVDAHKLRPEQARGILPLDTKSELVMTGFESDWIHFFNMRTDIAETGMAHEDMRYVVDQLLEEFLRRNYINEDSLYKHI